MELSAEIGYERVWIKNGFYVYIYIYLYIFYFSNESLYEGWVITWQWELSSNYMEVVGHHLAIRTFITLSAFFGWKVCLNKAECLGNGGFTSGGPTIAPKSAMVGEMDRSG